MKNAFIIVLAVTILFAAGGIGLLAWNSAQNRTDEASATQKAQEEYEKALKDYEDAIAQIDAQDRQNQSDYLAAKQKYDDEIAEANGGNKKWPAPAGDGWEIIDLSEYAVDQESTQTVDRQDLIYNGLLLVNQNHSRPSWYDDDKPVNLHTYNKEIRLDNHNIKLLESAAEAWANLITDVSTRYGWNDFMVYRGYRTYADQEKLFNERRDKLRSKYTDDSELIAATAKEVNLPGTSEYNSGLSLWPRLYKANDATVNAKDSNFFESEEGIWLVENAWEYGFVFRFPLADYPVRGTQEKGYKTGIHSRIRLFRYVGKANAAAMNILDMCLEEYLEYLQQHWHIAIYEDGELRYEIFLQDVEGSLDDSETTTIRYSTKRNIVSQEAMYDNLGHIVTVMEY